MAAWQPIFASSREIVGDDLFEIVYPDPDASKRDRVTAACCDEDPRQVWVAELEREVIGFIIIHMYPDRLIAEIGNNAVSPAFQGRGIGMRMYEFVLAQMKDAGMKGAIVETGGDGAHAPARQACEKDGFSGAVPSIMLHIKL